MNPVFHRAAFALLCIFVAAAPAATQSAPPQNPAPSSAAQIELKDTQYGFCFALPASWKGYTIVAGQWEGTPRDGGPSATGPRLLIRNPAWTPENPREDIPILIFTRPEWRRIAKEQMSVSAAPFNPFELGHNRRYVFALPARFDYDQLPGVEEVGKLVMGKSLKAPCP